MPGVSPEANISVDHETGKKSVVNFNKVPQTLLTSFDIIQHL
jgi:hypothetical protein